MIPMLSVLPLMQLWLAHPDKRHLNQSHVRHVIHSHPKEDIKEQEVEQAKARTGLENRISDLEHKESSLLQELKAALVKVLGSALGRHCIRDA